MGNKSLKGIFTIIVILYQKRRQIGLWILVGITFWVGGAGNLLAQPQSAANFANPSKTHIINAEKSYGNLPLYFEKNLGQTDARVKYITKGQGFSLFLTEDEMVFALNAPLDSQAGSKGSNNEVVAPVRKGNALFMRLHGANPEPKLEGKELLSGQSHYIIGNDPEKWHTHIPQYKKVAYRSIYPGIDLVFYGNQQQLEYDFIVEPGTDPTKIKIQFSGADSLTTDNEGNLLLQTAVGTLLQHKPFIYQEINGIRKIVPGEYTLLDNNRVGFQIAAYDTTRPLVIDPILIYSTSLGGGSNEQGTSIAVDNSGNAYVTGATVSGTSFPRTPGAFQTSGQVYISKLSPDGSSLVYSTVVSGAIGHGIAVDEAANVYITGRTRAGFPTTAGVVQTMYGGGIYDAFVTKLAPDGASLIYSTLIGGEGLDLAYDIAVDSTGQVYISGGTNSLNFPTTTGAYQTTSAGGVDTFAIKLNADATSLIYSTLLGGSRNEGNFSFGDIAIDTFGNAYLTGETESPDFPTTQNTFQTTFGGIDMGSFARSDAYITKLSPDGASLVYSTYLGGDGGEVGSGIAVDSAGQAYITGGILGTTNFPVTEPVPSTVSNTSAFVTKLATDGTSLVYSTILGGSGSDGPFGRDSGIAIDARGHAYVTGRTSSIDFPITQNAVQATLSGSIDGFVSMLTPDGSALLFSTYFGGNRLDVVTAIAVDALGQAYITGSSNSTNFPTTPGAFQETSSSLRIGDNNAFVARFNLAQAPLCDIQLTQQSYTESDVVTLSVLRYVNPSAVDVAVEVKVWQQTPSVSPVSIVNAGADGSFVLPAGADIDSGSIAQFTVTPLTPLGEHKIGCRMLDPITGALLSEDINIFSVVSP